MKVPHSSSQSSAESYMNQLFNQQIFSVGDWVRLVYPIIPLRDSTMFILSCWKYQTRKEVFYPISRHREVSWIYNEIVLSCLIISFLNEPSVGPVKRGKVDANFPGVWMAHFVWNKTSFIYKNSPLRAPVLR